MAKKKKLQQIKEKRVSIREEIKQLLYEIDEKRYDLYLKIYEVKRDQKFLEWGFENFRDWLERDLQIEYRVGLWYAQMGETIEKFNISKDVVLSVSWTKFKEICQLDSWEHIEPLLKKASGMSFKEVQAEVKQIKKNIAPKKEMTLTTLTLKLKEDQYDVIMQAVEKAKDEAGTDSIASALEYICQEYLVGGASDDIFELED